MVSRISSDCPFFVIHTIHPELSHEPFCDESLSRSTRPSYTLTKEEPLCESKGGEGSASDYVRVCYFLYLLFDTREMSRCDEGPTSP